METEAIERLGAELELLFAMYPESLVWSSKARELKYSHREEDHKERTPAVLVLRLPESYPLAGSPQVISATGNRKEDLRSAAVSLFRSTETPAGEEVLDALLLAFADLVSSRAAHQTDGDGQTHSPTRADKHALPSNRTVVIWLHHLLNTNKRKLALNPSVEGSKISGITKPGYPGVMIFCGEQNAVSSHVSELRSQKWQAFQIRFDSDDSDDSNDCQRVWRFSHGTGIQEVESMSDVAQAIDDVKQREVFLGSIGVR